MNKKVDEVTHMYMLNGKCNNVIPNTTDLLPMSILPTR